MIVFIVNTLNVMFAILWSLALYGVWSSKKDLAVPYSDPLESLLLVVLPMSAVLHIVNCFV